MSIQIPKEVQAFIDKLATLKPAPASIWLIGSRANGRATNKSDTDLLIFGSEELISTLQSECCAPAGVDCLVIYNGNDYKDPWQNKSGSLEKLEWHEIDQAEAIYKGVKWVPDEDSSVEFGADLGNFDERKEYAIRLWPREL